MQAFKYGVPDLIAHATSATLEPRDPLSCVRAFRSPHPYSLSPSDAMHSLPHIRVLKRERMLRPCIKSNSYVAPGASEYPLGTGL